MVVILTKDKNGNVVTTVEELTEWLKKAENEGYARGYSDGIKESWKPWSYTYTAPSITLNPCDNKHPDDALDALRFATNIDIRANTNGDEIILAALPKNDEERKILDNAINNAMSCSTKYADEKYTYCTDVHVTHRSEVGDSTNPYCVDDGLKIIKIDDYDHEWDMFCKINRFKL